jgi:hypothetical protein
MKIRLAAHPSLYSQKTATKTAKPMSAHAQAVKACNDTYNAAMKEARTKKGKERTDAMAAARTTRKDCLKNAPK